MAKDLSRSNKKSFCVLLEPEYHKKLSDYIYFSGMTHAEWLIGIVRDLKMSESQRLSQLQMLKQFKKNSKHKSY